MSNLTSSITMLEASLATTIGASFNIDNQPDVIAQLLADKRSPNTRRGYMKDINDFFKVVANTDSPSRDLVLEFLHLEPTQAVQLVLSYKAKLIERGLKEATINRRLAAIKSLAAMGRTLSILGKGKGTSREVISLPPATVLSISEWLDVRGTAATDAPLFIAVDNANYGRRLSGNGIYTIVDRLFKQAGIAKKMSPHRVRHSSITAALDATDGNIRKVQKLSRHANINTLMTYDDNRNNYQEEMSQLLDELV